MPRITEIWAYVAEDAGPDDEGIGAFMLPSGEWMPMVGADAERMASLKPIARNIAKVTNKPFKLVRFSIREDVEVIQP